MIVSIVVHPMHSLKYPFPVAERSAATTSGVTPVVAIVSMGEMGAALAARLVSRGVEVRTSLQGRGEATRRRAEAIGVQVFKDDVDLVSVAGIIFSIVPPDAALAVAARFRDAIQVSGLAPVYIDCNAISPQRMSEIAAMVTSSGGQVADASILGLAPLGDRDSPRIYVAGRAAESLLPLMNKGLDFRLIADKPVGAASALKCAYAAVAKSVAVIGAQAAFAAQQGGIAALLRDELSRFQPSLWASIERDFATFEQKAYRWTEEMREIARFLSQAPGGKPTFEGLAQMLEAVEQMRVSGSLPELEAWAAPHSSNVTKP